MKTKIGYNGESKQRRFHKIKKHIEIIYRRLSFSSSRNRIVAINNPILNRVLESIMTVKDNNYKPEDIKVFEYVEDYRKKLLSDNTEVTYEIFNSSATRKIKDICRIAASPKLWGQFLYLIAKNNRSKSVLEIGTNVGISGLYTLSGMKHNHREFEFVTMEGLGQLCDLSRNKFEELFDKENFKIINGLYDDTFESVIGDGMQYDLLFIDGNHQKEPTIQYFYELKKCISDQAIFIFDDIYYNIGMKEAWDIIKEDESVNFSIDMYKLGIVIIDKSETKKNVPFGIHMTY